jgi:hypothetical protein
MVDENVVILEAVVGSTAYGLDRPGSDVDRLGIYAAPTLEVAGLDWSKHRETQVTTDPDVTMHEVGKFCRLALKGNPTITELLWVEHPLFKNWAGQWLVDFRTGFLSSHAVANAYLGYALAQARKLESRGDGSFSADTRKRTAKHGRHMLRLLRQGRELLETGELTLRVPDPQIYWDFDDMTSEQMLEVYRREAELTRTAIITTVLPDQPHRESVRAVLNGIRKGFL